MGKNFLKQYFTYRKTYAQFLLHFKKEKTYCLNQEFYRQQGNTTAIIKLAKKYKSFVLVSTLQQKRLLIERGLPQEQIIVVTLSLKELKGRKFSILFADNLLYTTFAEIENTYPNIAVIGTFIWDIKIPEEKKPKTEIARSSLKTNKTVIILNGSGRSGKDTFAKFVGEYVPSYKVSSIDFVKKLYSKIDCKDIKEKTEAYRKLLSQTKANLIDFDSMFFAKLMKQEVDNFLQSQEEILFVDIREPEEIDKFKFLLLTQEVEVLTVLVRRDSISQICSNSSDANVYNYPYDFIIENNGELKKLKDCARCFAVATGYCVEQF